MHRWRVCSILISGSLAAPFTFAAEPELTGVRSTAGSVKISVRDKAAGASQSLMRRGDTGAIIASDIRLSRGSLSALNQGVNWNELRAGQLLRIKQ